MLEVLVATVRQVEDEEISALEVLELLLAGKCWIRETRRIKMNLMTARLTRIKTKSAICRSVAGRPSA